MTIKIAQKIIIEEVITKIALNIININSLKNI